MAKYTKEQLKKLYEQAKEEYTAKGYTESVERALDTLVRNDWSEFGFVRYADFETVRQKVLKFGTPMANVGMVQRLFQNYFSSETTRAQVKQHADKILASGDIVANYECYKINKNTFRQNLEVLNQPQNKEVYNQYISEKISNMTTIAEVEQLDFIVQKLNDVVLAHKLLARVQKIALDEHERASIWERLATLFVEAEDANESIWYLLKKPENVPMDAYFDKLEQHVLDSKNGDFNVMFLAKYPNINFKAHEQAILNSTSGMAIRQFAGMFGGREQSFVKDSKQKADLQGCINALSHSDSELAMYAFAIHYDQFSDLDLAPLFERLKRSETHKYQEYGNHMSSVVAFQQMQ